MVIDLLASPNFAQYDLSSLVTIGGGGAAMPQAVAQRLEQYGLRYAEGYGLTETAAPSHYNPPDATQQQCLGIPTMGTEARVVDPDTCRRCRWASRARSSSAGRRCSAATGSGRRPPQLPSSRWTASGSSVRAIWAGDEDGYFFLTDRLKRMINASGFKVWPAEVESLMFRHPAIQEACIIAARDAYRGETVKAVVVLRPGLRRAGQRTGHHRLVP